MEFRNKLECLSMWSSFQELNTRISSALPANIRLGRKGLSGDIHSSLSRKSVNYGRKKFYRIGPKFDLPPTWYYLRQIYSAALELASVVRPVQFLASTKSSFFVSTKSSFLASTKMSFFVSTKSVPSLEGNRSFHSTRFRAGDRVPRRRSCSATRRKSPPDASDGTKPFRRCRRSSWRRWARASPVASSFFCRLWRDWLFSIFRSWNLFRLFSKNLSSNPARPSPGPKVIKLFMSVIYECS